MLHENIHKLILERQKLSQYCNPFISQFYNIVHYIVIESLNEFYMSWIGHFCPHSW